MNQRKVGLFYEARASAYLQRQGLQLIQQNFVCRGGEIDLIMRDRETWVFIEVRYRKNNVYGGAIESITATKKRRLLAAAANWLSQREGDFESSDCRFDVCIITGSQLIWLENAFNLED